MYTKFAKETRNQMKTIKKHWGKLALALSVSLIVAVAGVACISAWGQTLPGLSIAMTNTNTAVSLTVTNGTNTAVYEIYSKEYLDDEDWILISNGTTGQTNFIIDLTDAESTFYRAQINTNGGAGFTLSISIVAPANGANIQ